MSSRLGEDLRMLHDRYLGGSESRKNTSLGEVRADLDAEGDLSFRCGRNTVF